MEKSVVQALREERADLKRKLRAVDDLLLVYGVEKNNKNKPPSTPLSTPQTRYRIPSERTSAIRDIAKELIAPNGNTPTLTRHILAHVESKGLDVGGKNPVATLSALLSHTNGFRSIGRSGWVYDGDDITQYKKNSTSGVAAPEADKNR